jgi:5,5'-dehydrodivanillate O-demethylase
MRIPIDDENTMIYWYTIYHSPDTLVPEQKTIPFFDVPYKDDQGKMYVDSVEHQDLFVWVTQGRTARRTSEHLGASDKGVIMYRQVLREQMEKVQRGEDPLGTVRDPEINQFIHLPEEARSKYYDGVQKNILLKQATPTYRWLPEPYKKELHSIFDMEKHV